MNRRFKLHPDGTLEITMPKGKKVSRVLVCEAGTQNGTLMYPDCDDCIKHGGDWECDHVNCHKGKNVPSADLSIAEQCIPRKCKDDLVSRRQVYKLKLASDNDWEFGQALMDMPSAEPEPCEDTISRSEAIKVIEAVPDGNWKSTRYSKEIRRLPSAEPERKKGKWIVTSEFEDCRYVKCNQCKVTQVFYYNKPLTNFCPNCGSYMRGEQDD